MALSRLKRIAPLSAALVVGLINAIVGLITGILITLSATIFPQYLSMSNIMSEMMGFSGNIIGKSLLLIVLYPITGFVSGFIGTLLIVWLYNLIAKKVQIKLELK